MQRLFNFRIGRTDDMPFLITGPTGIYNVHVGKANGRCLNARPVCLLNPSDKTLSVGWEYRDDVAQIEGRGWVCPVPSPVNVPAVFRTLRCCQDIRDITDESLGHAVSLCHRLGPEVHRKEVVRWIGTEQLDSILERLPSPVEIEFLVRAVFEGGISIALNPLHAEVLTGRLQPTESLLTLGLKSRQELLKQQREVSRQRKAFMSRCRPIIGRWIKLTTHAFDPRKQIEMTLEEQWEKHGPIDPGLSLAAALVGGTYTAAKAEADASNAQQNWWEKEGRLFCLVGRLIDEASIFMSTYWPHEPRQATPEQYKHFLLQEVEGWYQH